ncbi:hypothetical protein EBT16_07875, partial [bacterium]|nr:hypothetical protein [bacterium]
KEETLSEFFQPGGEALWAQAYLDINDPSGLQKTLKNVPKERSLAGKNGKDELLALSPFSLILGKAFRLLGDFSKSEFYLNKVSDPALEDAALSEKMKTWVSLGKANLAIESGLKALGRKPANQNQEMLFQLRDAVVEGKQWKLSEKVFQTAQKVLGNEKTILPFVTMEGRALLEQGKCKESNQIYSEALKLDPTAKDVAETRFNRGRCLSQLKDLEGAKKEWQEVASLKDEFWSPLAVNELKLLEKP